MGCSNTTSAKTKQIDKESKAMKKKRMVKLLLLGAGDSGKSTFLKQLKILHMGFSVEEMRSYVHVLQENCITSMKLFLHYYVLERDNLIKKSTLSHKIRSYVTDNSHTDNNDNDDESRTIVDPSDYYFPDDQFQVLLQRVNDTEQLQDCATELSELWTKEAGLKLLWNKRNERNLLVSPNSAFYFDNALRFIDETFVPSQECLLKARAKTTGVKELVLESNDDYEVTIVDVGGQRSERRKWIHCFGDCSSIIFLTALDEYNLCLEEDNSVNRLRESLDVFTNITQNTDLSPLVWILFLNKSDLFEEKIRKVPLNTIFKEVPKKDGKDFEKGWRFIKGLFENAYKGKVNLMVHLLCSLETKMVETVYADVKNAVLSDVLLESGIM